MPAKVTEIELARLNRRGFRLALALAALALGAVTVLVASERSAARGSSGSQWAPSANGLDRAQLWIVGDGGKLTSAMPTVELVESLPMDRFIYLGDVYQSGTAAEFAADYAPGFGRFASKTAPTPGNHEWPNRSTGYYAYWSSVRGSPPPRWYRFNLAGWQFLIMNSEAPRGSGSAQARWLKRALRRSRGMGSCRAVVTHKPRYSGGLHGDQPSLSRLESLLAGKARAWFSGHDHSMQRVGPTRGITQFVAGAAGRGRYPVDPDHPRLRFANDTDDGALRLTLRRGRGTGGSATWRFVSTSGETLDRGTLRCRRSR